MAQTKNIAVVISGCGVYDGAEIHEATMTLFAIAKAGANYQIFAPDIPQHHVINHLTGEEMKESRNVLIESARIARGDIKPLSDFDAKQFDGIIFPGGFGAAKNLSNFAFKGADATVKKEVEKAVKDMLKEKKPIGALCISPAVIAKIINGVEVTIGQDKDTAKAIEAMGGKHKTTGHAEVTIDEKHKVVTNPCYMLDATIIDIAAGAENVVKSMLDLM